MFNELTLTNIFAPVQTGLSIYNQGNVLQHTTFQSAMTHLTLNPNQGTFFFDKVEQVFRFQK